MAICTLCRLPVGGTRLSNAVGMRPVSLFSWSHNIRRLVSWPNSAPRSSSPFHMKFARVHASLRTRAGLAWTIGCTHSGEMQSSPKSASKEWKYNIDSWLTPGISLAILTV